MSVAQSVSRSDLYLMAHKGPGFKTRKGSLSSLWLMLVTLHPWQKFWPENSGLGEKQGEGMRILTWHPIPPFLKNMHTNETHKYSIVTLFSYFSGEGSWSASSIHYHLKKKLSKLENMNSHDHSTMLPTINKFCLTTSNLVQVLTQLI